MRLLLVEDEVEIQGFLQRSLAEAGYQVDAAGDARTAERITLESTHDVLVVDLGLPDEDGLTLILRLRQLGLRAPVFILSARRSVDDRVRGLEQGGDDYLTKSASQAMAPPKAAGKEEISLSGRTGGRCKNRIESYAH